MIIHIVACLCFKELVLQVVDTTYGMANNLEHHGYTSAAAGVLQVIVNRKIRRQLKKSIPGLVKRKG